MQGSDFAQSDRAGYGHSMSSYLTWREAGVFCPLRGGFGVGVTIESDVGDRIAGRRGLGNLRHVSFGAVCGSTKNNF